MLEIKPMLVVEGDLGYADSQIAVVRSMAGSLNVRTWGPRTDHGGTMLSLSPDDARSLAEFILLEFPEEVEDADQGDLNV